MTSRRTTPLPPNWSTIRQRILTRDQHTCTWIRTDGTRCTQPATDVHHITSADNGGTDHDTNLTSLCGWHHRRITSTQAQAKQTKPRTQRDTEPHPGIQG